VLLAYLAVLVLATTALAASGCGGSSITTTTTDASTTAAPPTTSTATTTAATATAPKVAVVTLAAGKPLTRAQWIARGEAICARLNAQLAANTVKSTSEFARVLPLAAADERTEFTALVKLVPPPSDAKAWQRFLTDTEQWAENSSKLAQSETPGQFTLKVPLVTSTKDLHERLAAIAKRAGFKECALV
jgi:hypothetical protein